MKMNPTLYIVSTPIGNPADITLRAISVLEQADALICEEYRNGSKLLKQLKIAEKPILTLNEHNEAEQIESVLIRLAQGESLALVSDCGTPLFSDPGHLLVEMTGSAGFSVVPIPGVSALTAVIAVTPIKMERYFFAGFLPRIPKERIDELKRLKLLRVPIILMDTPYRLNALLENVIQAFGKGMTVTLACNLTMPNELILTGKCDEVLQRVKGKKCEFMLVVHNGVRNTPLKAAVKCHIE